MPDDFTFHFRDSRTGRDVATAPQRPESFWPPAHQFSGRRLFVGSRVNHEPSGLAFLRQWLPLGDRPASQIHCIDLATGGEAGRLEFADVPRFHFAETHGMLATWHSDADGREVLACWDVPFRPAWSWVLAPPLGLVVLAPGFAAWRRWRRATDGLVA